MISFKARQSILPGLDFFGRFSCALCRKINGHCEERRLPASKFQYTADRGCLMCKLITNAVTTFVIDQQQRETCHVSLNGGLCLYLRSGLSRTRLPIDVYCLPSAKCPWDDIDRKINLSESTASLDAYSQAKQLIGTCSSEHNKYLPQVDVFPTRLLDLNVRVFLFGYIPHLWFYGKPHKCVPRTYQETMRDTRFHHKQTDYRKRT